MLTSPKIKNLLVVVAMDAEEQAILLERTSIKVDLNKRLKLSMQKISGPEHSISILNCGIGSVNTALALGYALDHHIPDAVIMLGVGGALDKRLNIGDVVISTGILQHDCLYSGDLGNELMAPGELFLSVNAHERQSPLMKADPDLMKWLTQLYGQPSKQQGALYSGIILSGSEFVATSKRKLQLAKTHQGALLVEMEAAAAAQVCRKFKVPFAMAKTVADRLNPLGTISEDYTVSLKAAANRAADLIKALTPLQ